MHCVKLETSLDLTWALSHKSGCGGWPGTFFEAVLSAYGGRHQKSWTPRLLANISDNALHGDLGSPSEYRVRACPGLFVPSLPTPHTDDTGNPSGGALAEILILAQKSWRTRRLWWLSNKYLGCRYSNFSGAESCIDSMTIGSTFEIVWSNSMSFLNTGSISSVEFFWRQAHALMAKPHVCKTFALEA